MAKLINEPALEVKISSSGGDILDIITEIASKRLTIKGVGYTNPQNGVVGIVLFNEENTKQTIDLFVVNNPV